MGDAVGRDLGIVIPCFNEAHRLAATLDTTLRFFEDSPWALREILVVDDGSSDGTPDVARTHPDRRVRVVLLGRNLGKGAAVRRGMVDVRGGRRLFMDADLATPLTNLGGLMDALDRGHDVAIGSRALPASVLGKRQPPWRERSGRLFNSAVRALGLSEFGDTQCGFKLFTSRAADVVFPHVTSVGWAFDVEVLVVARQFGLRIAEVAVSWRAADDSRFRVLRHGVPTLLELAAIRRRWGREDSATYEAET